MSQSKAFDAEINNMLCKLDKLIEESKDSDGTLSTLYKKLTGFYSKCQDYPTRQNRLKRSQSLTLSSDKANKNAEVNFLLFELKKTKKKLSKPCEMCKDYELKLQTVESHERDVKKQVLFRDEIIKECKGELKKEKTLRIELEEKFTQDAKENEKKMMDWRTKLDSSNKELFEFMGLFSNYYNEANQKISNLIKLKEDICKEMTRLHSENDALLGRHIVKSEEMQREAINMPSDLSEMQFHCLKMREDLITALLLKERNEETYRSEILFLKEQNIAEQQAKDKIEENLTQDNDNLRTERDAQEKELKTLKHKLKEKTYLLNESQAKLALLSQETEEQISHLTCEVSQKISDNVNQEEEISKLRIKVQSLQIELDNSEAVQRDFVKLSQSLQIQLEKIRQTNSEVRWQHEDDVSECSQCKKNFHSRKEKSHCSHCGRIFCHGCNSKIIYGGPNRRPFKVCSVCHTLLDSETAPYFSNVPPQSPS